MNFSIDKENKKINVERTFDAPLQTVWDAWTKSEILDKWWAPKPWKAKTKILDFKPGGQWLYSMNSPEGEAHWSRFDFQTIDPLDNFSVKTAFCDENGVVSDDAKSSIWKNSFSEASGKTHVSVDISFNSVEDVQRQIDMGFKEGFTMGLNNLDELLSIN